MKDPMRGNSDWQEILDALRTFMRFALAGLFDSFFLVIWVITQSITDQLISRFQLTGVDYLVLIVFQILFAISTLIPIATYISCDAISSVTELVLILNKAKQKIHQSKDGEYEKTLPSKIQDTRQEN